MAAKRRREQPDLEPLPAKEAGDAAALRWLQAMEAAAKRGDDRAAAALRESRKVRPELWDLLVGVSGQAEEAWLAVMAPDTTEHTAAREMLRHSLSGMRTRLLAGSSDPVDELLVSRVLATWLAANHADQMAAHQHRSSSVSFRQLEYFDGMAERAHRAHLRAIESLAKVQRLRRPTLQVNVGAVNVGAIPAGSRSEALPAGSEIGEVIEAETISHAVG